jgi:hypothetical protein
MSTSARSLPRPAPTGAAATTPVDGRVRTLGAACAAGGLLGVLISIVQVVYATSSTTPDDLWRSPWSSGTFVVVGLLWCVSHVLVLAGLVGMRRSGHGGPGRAAAAGAALALAGTSLILAGEIAGLTIGDQAEDSSAAGLVGAVYGVGTLMAVIGLTLFGRQVLRTATWAGWRRWTPLALAGWGVMLLWLPLTPLAPVGLIVIDSLFLALGAALYTQPSPGTPGRVS